MRDLASSRYPHKKVSFDATRGEILGFAGLVGAGRSEIAKAMVGLDPIGHCEVSLGGKTLRIEKPRDAIDAGIYLVPEDRRGEGLVVQMSVRENVTLPSVKGFSRWGLISRERERACTEKQVNSLQVKTPNVEVSGPQS